MFQELFLPDCLSDGLSLALLLTSGDCFCFGGGDVALDTGEVGLDATGEVGLVVDADGSPTAAVLAGGDCFDWDTGATGELGLEAGDFCGEGAGAGKIGLAGDVLVLVAEEGDFVGEGLAAFVGVVGFGVGNCGGAGEDDLVGCCCCCSNDCASPCTMFICWGGLGVGVGVFGVGLAGVGVGGGWSLR